MSKNPPKTIETECYYCHKKFQRLLAEFTRKEQPKHRFCSLKCEGQFHCLQKAVNCKQCGKKFIKTNAEIKRSPNHFCCKSCAVSYNNTHKTKGTRRSKLETWLEEQLTILYPNLEVHYNKTDAINGELDIYIPSLKLAFELNGIFHYEPIYGADKLIKVMTNDNRKFQACLEKTIELCIIDVSKLKYMKLQRMQPFLEIICDIINEKCLT